MRMKGHFAFFCLGFATGYMGAVAVRRLREIDWGEDTEKIRQKLAENVQALEERIETVLEATGGEAAASA